MASMRKEVTIGFSLITLLLLVLGGLIYRRATTMWQTPEADELAAAMPPSPIAAIDGQPRVVMAQEGFPADADPTAGEQSYTPPADRQEQVRSSFMPRQFDQADADPTGSQDSSPDDGAVDRNAEAMPADASQVEPSDGRQTSLEVAERDFANIGSDRQGTGADPQGIDAGGGFDPATDQADMAPEPSREEMAEGLATSGSIPSNTTSDPTYNQQSIPDQAGAPMSGFAEIERRESFANERERERQFSRAHQEPERVAVENGKYTVAPNDSYWIIAEKVYGNGAYFKALFEHNRARHPRSDKLQVGDVLDAPSAALLADRYPDLCPRPRKVPSARQTLQPASTRRHAGERVYVVGEGDTLFDIARHELGKASRWTEIYDLNHDVLGEDFDYLRPGTELALPRDHRESDTVTRKDDPVYQR